MHDPPKEQAAGAAYRIRNDQRVPRGNPARDSTLISKNHCNASGLKAMVGEAFGKVLGLPWGFFFRHLRQSRRCLSFWQAGSLQTRCRSAALGSGANRFLHTAQVRLRIMLALPSQHPIVAGFHRGGEGLTAGAGLLAQIKLPANPRPRSGLPRWQVFGEQTWPDLGER